MMIITMRVVKVTTVTMLVMMMLLLLLCHRFSSMRWIVLTILLLHLVGVSAAVADLAVVTNSDT